MYLYFKFKFAEREKKYMRLFTHARTRVVFPRIICTSFATVIFF
jgi:hypothetical protein